MRILMLSRDASGLDLRSSTATRWRMLREAGVELEIFVAAKTTAMWEETGLRVQSAGGATMWQRMWRLYRLARRRALMADLITAQDPFELGLIAWHLARASSKRFEIQDHGGFFDGQIPDEPLWWIRSRLAAWIVHRASVIRTVNPRSFERLIKQKEEQGVYFLPIAAQSRFADMVRQPEMDHLVTVSRLVSVKRIDLLLQAVAELRKTRPHAHLTIVGDGPLRGSLERQTKDLGLQDAVRFVGSGDPFPWLQMASAFVLVSRHEGWGIASIEAALAGIPVVMTETGCGPWLAAQGVASLVRVDASPVLIAQKIDETLRQPTTGRISGLLPLEESATRQVEEWRKVVERGPRLLVCVQAVDQDDALMGYFHEWLAEASVSFSSIDVCALRVGRMDLPANIQVHALRPRDSRSRVKVIWMFWKISWLRRHSYDAVFVRGDAQYMVFAGWLWRLLGKKIIFWFAHYTSRSIWVPMAGRVAHRVVTSVRAACRLPYAIPIGQGVHALPFITQDIPCASEAHALVFGRISPSKRVAWMLQEFSDHNVIDGTRLTLIGRATDEQEAGAVRQLASKLSVIWEERDVTHAEAAVMYRQFGVFLNATPGSLDKTIVEAMLTGLVVVASTPGFGEMLPADLSWLCPVDAQFARAATRALSLSLPERRDIGTRLRAFALERHSQTQQIEKIRNTISALQSSKVFKNRTEE